MNLQSAYLSSTGLVPIFQCLSCVRETKTGHNTPDVVSQLLNRGEGSLPGAAGNTVGLLYFKGSTHSTCFLSAPFPWHCFLSTLYCSCGYSNPDARLCTCLHWTSWVFHQSISLAWWSHSELPA